MNSLSGIKNQNMEALFLSFESLCRFIVRNVVMCGIYRIFNATTIGLHLNSQFLRMT